LLFREHAIAIEKLEGRAPLAMTYDQPSRRIGEVIQDDTRH
jgi:YD repeat-containing protein